MALAVFVTIPEEQAEKLTKQLLQERVCACVNIIKGVNSFYWWQDKIDNSQESMLMIKTKESLFPKLKRLIKNNHPYDVPEIITFTIDKINQDYLSWLNKEANASPTV